MHKRPLLTLALISSLIMLPACAAAGSAVVGTVGTAAKVAVGTAGTATNVAVRTAGAAGNVAIGTASIGQRAAASAATGAANGAAREGGRLAVRGAASAGQAGFRAMMNGDSSVSQETLAQRAGLSLSYPRTELTIGNVYEEGTRTDFTALSPHGEAANCYVMQERGTVTDAICQPAPQ